MIENPDQVSIEMQHLQRDQDAFKKLDELLFNGVSSDKSSYLSEIKSLIDEFRDDFYERNYKGKNIFHVVATCATRCPEVIEILALENYEVKVKDLVFMKYKNKAPIHLAVENGFTAFVEEMLKLYPDLVTLPEDGERNTPLHIAAKSSRPESYDCVKCILQTAENCDKIEEVLKATNNSGNTPIHTLCSHVPKNQNANVSEKFYAMSRYDYFTDALNIVNKYNLSPLHVLCSKEEQSESDMNNPNLCSLVGAFVNKTGETINEVTQDGLGRTALHLACMSEYAKLTEILARHQGTNVTITDSKGRMAIHYAAEKSISAAGHNCTKVLADWELFHSRMKRSQKPVLEARERFRNYLLWETDGDIRNGQQQGTAHSKGDTVLTLCCKAKSAKTVELILRSVWEAKSTFDTWFSGRNSADISDIYSLQLVYKYTPEALEFLFDKSISIDFEESNERKVKFTTNVSVITALTTPVKVNQPTSEMKYLAYSNRWSKDVRETLLLHPLTKCVLQAAWQRMFMYNILWIVINVVWLVAYSILIPYEYSNSGKYPFHQQVAAWTLATITLLYCLNELMEVKISGISSYCRIDHLLMRVNIWHWLQMVVTGFAIYKLVGNLGGPNDLEKYCGAAGVVLSYVLFWRNIGIVYIPLGIQVEYLVETLKQIIVAILCCAPLIFGFAIAFRQVLSDHFEDEKIWALTKTIVMMTGEFEYTEMFSKSNNDNCSCACAESTSKSDLEMSAASRTLNLLAFIVFLVIVPVAFYNLITGLVVDKVKDMKSRIEMHHMYNHIRLVNYVQRSINKFPCFGFIFRCFISYRSTSNGETVLDQELKWYITNGIESSRWTRFTNWLNEVISNKERCANFLSADMKRKIIETYQVEQKKRYNTYDVCMDH